MKKLLPILLISLAALWACDEKENIALNNTITEFIEQKYAGARILYAEQEFNGDIEVEIIHNNIRKEVKFNRKNKWINTIWDISINHLPDAVKESIGNNYPEYLIDDADYIESPSGNFYKVEIEKGEWDKTVFVTANGEIIN